MIVPSGVWASTFQIESNIIMNALRFAFVGATLALCLSACGPGMQASSSVPDGAHTTSSSSASTASHSGKRSPRFNKNADPCANDPTCGTGGCDASQSSCTTPIQVGYNDPGSDGKANLDPACAFDATGPGCQVARRLPKEGDDCWGSPGPKIGDNMPVNSSSPSTTVTNIAAMTFTQSGGGTNAWAWIYTEKGGDVYIAANANYRDSFEGFMGGIPAVSGVLSAIQNAQGGLVPLSSSQGQTIMSQWALQPGHTSGSCFTKPFLA